MTIGYVIATGSPFDGLTLLGLYKTRDEACDVAIQDYDEGEWFVVPIEEGCESSSSKLGAGISTLSQEWKADLG